MDFWQVSRTCLILLQQKINKIQLFKGSQCGTVAGAEIYKK